VARIKLKGLNWTTKRLKSGRVVTHYYAWRGGPKLPGKAGSPEFMAAYNAAWATRGAEKAPATTLAEIVVAFRSSPEYATNAQSTRMEWGRWLDRIAAHQIGKLSTRVLDAKGAKAVLLKWRDEYAKTSLRNADYAIQVLSACLGWAAGREIIAANPVKGVATLYESDRADMIWSDSEIARFCEKASPEVGRALRLACETGLRRADLVSLTWGEVGEFAITKNPSKAKVKALPGALQKKRTRTKRAVMIPLTPGARALLEEIGRGDADGAVLRNSRGKPWTGDGLENRIIKAKAEAGLAELHLHDARGTFITRLAQAGLKASQIAGIVGWKEARVERLLTAYVDQERVILHLAKKLSSPTKNGGEA
jgi:integrase